MKPDPKNAITQAFSADSFSTNAVIETLAILLYKENLIYRPTWYDLSHDEREKYRAMAKGEREFKP